MADEIKLHKAKERGAAAEALKRNEMLQEAFKIQEQLYTKAWMETEPHEAEARENYWRALQILVDVQNHLVRVVNNGKLANREIDQLANKFRPRAA